MDRKTGEEHWTMKMLLYVPPESCRETGLHKARPRAVAPLRLHPHSHRPSAPADRRHSLVVVAEAAIEDDGAVGEDLEEVLAVPSARDDLRQSTVKPEPPSETLGLEPWLCS